MKNRIIELEKENPPDTDSEALIRFAEQWRLAAIGRKWKKADDIREKAESIFEKEPEYRASPPLQCGKLVYIDWRWFADWQDKHVRKEYIEATIQGIAPNFFSLQKQE